MNQRLIRTEAERQSLIRYHQSKGMPFTTTTKDGDKRSNPQNRLQMKWCKEAAMQGDNTAEEYRAYCKLHFGVPILREDEDFQASYDQKLKWLPYETKLALMGEFDFPVSRLMQVEQMRRYLDAIYQHFTGLGFQLTDPNWQGMDVA